MLTRRPGHREVGREGGSKSLLRFPAPWCKILQLNEYTDCVVAKAGTVLPRSDAVLQRRCLHSPSHLFPVRASFGQVFIPFATAEKHRNIKIGPVSVLTGLGKNASKSGLEHFSFNSVGL